MGSYLKHRSVLVLITLAVIWIALQQVNTAGGVDKALERLAQFAFFVFPAFLIGIVLHEWAHAYTASLLGDPTARMLGRLTLNPLKHLDPLGTAMIVVAGFGWANPVPINPAYFRNPKRDMAMAAGAGPLMNFLIAAIAIGIINVAVPPYQRDSLTGLVRTSYVFQFLLELAMINALLGVFNLLPIHPLDGHHFLRLLLSPRAFFTYKQNELLIAFVGLALLLSHFFDPLFRGVQDQVLRLCLAQFWGVP